MKKLIVLLSIIGFSLNVLAAPSNTMPTTNTFTAGTAISSANVNTNFTEDDAIYNAHTHSDITTLGTVTSGTWAASTLQAPTGSVSSPSITFQGDTNTGFYNFNDNIFMVAGGTIYGTIGSNGFKVHTGKLVLPDGSAADPSVVPASDSTGNTGFYFGNDNDGVYVSTGGTVLQYWVAGAITIKGDMVPAGAGTYSSGNGSNYWGDISYKTLTDRGCLGWFDDGVEQADGSMLSDIEAIKAIGKHPTKNTIYGVPMLDYKTFPKVAYKQAKDKDGYLLPRDENDEPYAVDEDGEIKTASDGIEMTSVFSIMLGAIKELSAENDKLRAEMKALDDKNDIKIQQLTDRLEDLEAYIDKKESKEKQLWE